MEIIPAIDIIDGKCVRLTEGNFDDQKIYHEHPLEIAKKFESYGFQYLHVVDLDGAKAGEVKNWDVLKSIAENTGLKIDFGGGVKNMETAEKVLSFGATWCTIGSLAIKKPKEFDHIIKNFGAGSLFIGADVKDKNIMVGGWLEKSTVNLFDFIDELMLKGIRRIFCTDISKDGKLEGPAIDLYAEIIQQYPELSLIASGGVSKEEDLVSLKSIGCSGVIIGKAIYENRISLERLAAFNNSGGLNFNQ